VVRFHTMGLDFGVAEVSGRGKDDQSKEMQEYFGELLEFDHIKIKHEPAKLVQDVEDRKKLLDDCVSSHYNVYLSVHEKMKSLGGVLRDCSECLKKIEDVDVPDLQEQANEFRKKASQENSTREALRHVYSHQGMLLDILEIPSLMDTCVRAGNYDEALELKSFGRRLRMIHGDIPVVVMLSRDIEAVLEVMVEQLLEKLQSSIQLAECLKVVGYLKRMNAFPSDAVALKKEFLERRGCWIDASLRELGDSLPPYEYLKKITDIYRLQMFDILMQYRAIFYSKDGAVFDVNDPSFSWSYKRMVFYLAEMQTNLPLIEDGGSLASVLDHCMYCGKALARVGLDFRPTVFPMFQDAAYANFERLVQVADEVFQEMIATHRWVAIPSVLNRAMEMSKNQKEDEKEEESAKVLTKGIEPPIVLVEHPPLAVYTNGLLAGFNELRHCAPSAIKDRVAECLRVSFQKLAAALEERRMMNVDADELEVFNKAYSLVASVQLPFLVECFSTIYGSPRTPIIPETLLPSEASS